MDSAVKSQRPYTLLYADLIKMIMRVRDEINDHRYIAKIPELKRRARSEATQLVEDKAIREVRQLYLVDEHDEFVIDGIVHELLYKDFRDVYISQKEVEIINLEQNAHENYMTAKFSLDEPESLIAKRVYQRTVEIPIGGSLLPRACIPKRLLYISYGR
jgi:hypothetical protein